MKTILTTAIAAFALIGAVSSASAATYDNGVFNDRLDFWQTFADRD